MDPSTKFEDKLEGIENFLEWKYMIGIIIKESGLEKYIKDEVAEPTEVEAKEKHEQDLIKALFIYFYSFLIRLPFFFIMYFPFLTATCTFV